MVHFVNTLGTFTMSLKTFFRLFSERQRTGGEILSEAAVRVQLPQSGDRPLKKQKQNKCLSLSTLCFHFNFSLQIHNQHILLAFSYFHFKNESLIFLMEHRASKQNIIHAGCVSINFNSDYVNFEFPSFC